MTIALETIVLQPDVAEQIAYLATEKASAVDDLVDQALRAYLRQYQQEKIHAETDAFQAQKTALLTHYAGEYIAMHQGNVIDHDPDLRTLHLRVFAQVRHTPVLLKQVTSEGERELVFRSPRFERGSA